jgi:uncharacterized protein (TIGR02391 family)
MQDLPSLIPDPDDLLALAVEELGGVLIVHLNSYEGYSGHNGVVQHGGVNQHNFLNDFDQHPPYSRRQAEIKKALMEAWSWLQNEGFLVPNPDMGARNYFVSRRAARLKTREDFSAYRKANLLPRGHLHPLIASRVYPAFLRGEYDTAVFQAFREVEIAVRRAGSFPDDLVGRQLMREAFRPIDPKSSSVTPGPLTDKSLPAAEQEGMAHLFTGAISLYKNPQSHRNVPTDPIDAAEVIVFASHLLRLIDRLKVNP